MTFCSLKSVCKNALAQAQFGSRSLPDYRLLIHFHISQFTQFSLVQSKTWINKQLWFARSQRRHFAGKPVLAQPVNRLSVQGRVKQPRPQGAFPWLWRWGGKSDPASTDKNFGLPAIFDVLFIVCDSMLIQYTHKFWVFGSHVTGRCQGLFPPHL